MICSNCGADNRPGNILCEHCGAPLQPAPQPATPDASSSQQYLLVPTVDGSPVDLPDRATVGRMNTCDVSVPDKSVSREHARLTRLEDGYLLEDLQSTNGTLVNGYKISEATVVRPGDLLTFGTVDYRMESFPSPGENQSPWSGEELPEFSANAVASTPSDGAGEIHGQSGGNPAAWSSGGDEPPPARFIAADPGDVREDVRTEPAVLADEVVAAAAHMTDLVQRLADLTTAAPDVPPAQPEEGSVADIRSILASVPASPVTDTDLQETREVLEGLAANPKDLDLVMRVREMAPQLYRIVEQYAQLEAVVHGIAEELEQRSAG